MSYDSTLPSCCIECAQAYTIAHYQQPLEAYLISQNDSLNEEPKVDRMAPTSIKGPSSKSVSKDPRHVPETKRLNVSRNNHDDPSVTSVPSRSPRNPRKSGEREPVNGIEYNPLTSSVPAQNRSPSNRAHNRQQSQNSRETGLSKSASKPRKHNGDLPPIPTQDRDLPPVHDLPSTPTQDRDLPPIHDLSPIPTQDRDLPSIHDLHPILTQGRGLPPIPTQDTNSSNGGPQLQYPQDTRGSYSVDKPQAHAGPLSMPSVRTDERNQSIYAQTRPQTQQPRETRVSFSDNKPQDSDHVEIPSVPIQEKNRSNIPQTRKHSQSQETQTSSNANKPSDRAERPKASIPTQDQGQGRSASGPSKTDDTRPHLMHGTPSQMDTQYVNMLLALDDIPSLHNMLAKFFNWILLAGFILFPGTFTSLKNLGGSGESDQIEQQLVHAVTNIPL